jgi:hypothetical protein
MVKLFVPKIELKNQLFFEIFEYSGKDELIISKSAENSFSLVEHIEDADWVIIPVFITSLSTTSGKEFIKKVSELAKSFKKPFGVFSNSDLIINPGVEDVFLFTPGAYSTHPNLVEIPAILPYDPIQKWYNDDWTPWNTSGSWIGFCGQATINPIKMLKDSFKISKLRRDLKRGVSPYLTVPNFLPAWERARILRRLQSTNLKTDFIFRSRYNAGANTPEIKEKVEQEFYQNIQDSLFTVCVRGMGNYSVRFYQTLAMGRIPILVDSDSVLPFESEISYQKFILKVPFKERFQIDQLVKSFVNSKSADELVQMQKMARECWLKHFQQKGMLSNLAIQMKSLGDSLKKGSIVASR